MQFIIKIYIIEIHTSFARNYQKLNKMRTLLGNDPDPKDNFGLILIFYFIIFIQINSFGATPACIYTWCQVTDHRILPHQ